MNLSSAINAQINLIIQMKQNKRQQQKIKTSDPIQDLISFPMETLSKRQIKKKQRRYFKEEKGESLLSKLSKSSSLMLIKRRRKKPLRWSENETNTFYKCLEFFGKDFEMIASVFHNKRKRQILRKFHKERKRYPEQVRLSLQKHESNQIQKTCKESTFFENFFDKTDTSEDEMSFMDVNKAFGKDSIRNIPNESGGTNNIILEGLDNLEKGFERQIDRVNDQNEEVHQKNSLNDLLCKINIENGFQKESVGTHQKFMESDQIQSVNVDKPEKVCEEGSIIQKSDFWVSNRIEEEVSEKPPPNGSVFNIRNSDKMLKMISNQNFTHFDLELKKQSNLEIKPLDFYLKEYDDEDKAYK